MRASTSPESATARAASAATLKSDLGEALAVALGRAASTPGEEREIVLERRDVLDRRRLRDADRLRRPDEGDFALETDRPPSYKVLRTTSSFLRRERLTLLDDERAISAD